MTLRTRMLKASCGHCAYTVRLTRKWLLDAGPPICPVDGGSHGAMECPQFDDIVESELETWEADSRAESDIALHRQQWVDSTRKPHTCATCGTETESGDRMLRREYRTGGTITAEYLCMLCAPAEHAQGRPGVDRSEQWRDQLHMGTGTGPAPGF